jgi:hypothetical protein
MKYLSLKILFLCILAPPVFYIMTVLFVENRIHSLYYGELEARYIGDSQTLLSGNDRLKESINKNISDYLEKKPLLSWGVKIIITITTKNGSLLYPASFEEAGDDLTLPGDPIKIAADNFKLMNEGLILNLDVSIEHNAPLSNLLLGCYILASLAVMYFYYRYGSRKATNAEYESNREIERLQLLSKDFSNKMQLLEEKRKTLKDKFEAAKNELKDEKQKATRNEDEMVNEIVSLEEELDRNLALQKHQQKEIEEFTLRIAELEKENRKSRFYTEKGSASVYKRFKTLYKNVSIHKRAVNGFLDLSDDLKIKGEEIIHLLDSDPANVPIKRKVFSRKSNETILEVRFAYKGRLYFRKVKDQNIEILSIGSKNTQTKDLDFLGTF